MFKKRFLQLLKKIIVSCQPSGKEAYYDLPFTLGMVQAVLEGGSAGLRLNSPSVIRAARLLTKVPIIGLWKQEFSSSEVYITPTLESALAILEAGADIIALDATERPRPQESLPEIVTSLKAHNACLMADVSTLQEGIQAQQLGFDCIGTTLAGYTSYSRQLQEPDFRLLEELIKHVTLPIIMEGRIWTPEQAKQALNLGAYAVVIGSAITRPAQITHHFLTFISTDY